MNKLKEYLKSHKLKATAVGIFLVVVLAVTLTSAWVDKRQHKTNEFIGDGIYYDIRLIEDFEEKKNWSIQDLPIKKEVRVRNNGSHDEYGNSYIRIHLKEYMEIDQPRKVYSQEYFMIDENGEFITFVNEVDANSFVNSLSDHHEIKKIKGYYESQEYYYVVENNDTTGSSTDILGRKLLLDIIPGGKQPLEHLVNRSNPIYNQALDEDDLEAHHGVFPHGECTLYPIHLWDNDTIHKPSPFTEYVKWHMGDDVITYQEWLNFIQGKDPSEWGVNKWILDTSNKGWAYWGNPLTPQYEYTSNLLERVSLIKQPSGPFYYAIHVDMQAVSYDSLEKWIDLPNELKQAWDAEYLNR